MTIPLADTSDMIGLHRVFRTALDAAPTLVRTVDHGDLPRAAHVGSYYANVLGLLHVHHEGEDELVTPKLLERAPEHAELIASIASQHGDVLGGIAEVEGYLADWMSDSTQTARDGLADAIDRLNVLLTTHLDAEEREILPIAAAHITAAEWGELPGHGMRTFPGDKLWLILGLIQEQMTPGQVASMEAHMPPQLAQFWAGPGRGMFEAYVTELRS
jgi:hypothetical protein